MTINIHVCPNGCNSTFDTSVHVQESWEVDALGNYVELLGTIQTLHGPDDDNLWTCMHCGAEAETLECYGFELFLNHYTTEVFVPLSTAKCVYWRTLGDAALHSTALFSDESGQYIIIDSERVAIPPKSN